MRSFRRETLAFVATLAAAAVPANAAEPSSSATTIAPHRASYELFLKDNDGDIADAEGRIAFSVEEKDCAAYVLDYRFVARFQQDQEMVVTDQWTKSTESTDGERLTFQTKTFVDTQPQSETQGSAVTRDGTTSIAFSKPEDRRIEIPAAIFPMAHTIALIDKARAGERIIEEPIFDGDADAEKKLTSTAIVSPLARDARTARQKTEAAGTKGDGAEEGSVREPASAAGPVSKLNGLAAWRVSESFFNTDSDSDGHPVFQTAYTLYENGVSDDLVLTFDGYSLAGGLKSLDLLGRPDCR